MTGICIYIYTLYIYTYIGKEKKKDYAWGFLIIPGFPEEYEELTFTNCYIHIRFLDSLQKPCRGISHERLSDRTLCFIKKKIIIK